MNKRILVPLALLSAAALLTLTACGGGGPSDEDKIAETIEKAATTSDPSTCTELETQRFVEQNSTEKGNPIPSATFTRLRPDRAGLPREPDGGGQCPPSHADDPTVQHV